MIGNNNSAGTRGTLITVKRIDWPNARFRDTNRKGSIITPANIATGPATSGTDRAGQAIAHTRNAAERKWSEKTTQSTRYFAARM